MMKYVLYMGRTEENAEQEDLSVWQMRQPISQEGIIKGARL